MFIRWWTRLSLQLSHLYLGRRENKIRCIKNPRHGKKKEVEERGTGTVGLCSGGGVVHGTARIFTRSQKQLEPEDSSGLAARKLKHFRCRMGDGGPCKTIKFKECDTLKTAIVASVSFWGQDGRTNPPLISLCKQTWVPRVDRCRVKILQLMIRTKQSPEKIARYVISQYAGKIIFENAPRILYLDFVRAYALQVPAFQRELFQHLETRFRHEERSCSLHPWAICNARK